MLELVAKDGRLGQRDLVEEDDVEEVVRKMVMCRCGWGGWSLCMGRETEMDALLPCQKMVPKLSQKGVPRWGCSEVVGESCRCSQSMHVHW